MFSYLRNLNDRDRLRGKLAILMPTYRFDARARHTLAATAALASEEIAVLIGDNSENADKRDFLHKLGKLHSNIHIFCHAKNLGAMRNWKFLFDHGTLDYYLTVGDDDLCTPLYVENGMRLLQQHTDASAAAGPFIMVTSTNKMITGNGCRIEDTPYQRCINFQIGGGNSLPSSIAHRLAAQPFLAYLYGHPLHASFFDWLMSYTLLAHGKFYTADQGGYFYDASNWEGWEACWKSNAKFYVAAGLPEAFTWFHELYWAVECAHFFRGAYSPINDSQQSVKCAQYFYLNRIKEFRLLWERPDQAAMLEHIVSHHPKAVGSLRSLAANDDATHPALFDWFSEVLAAFHPECAHAYGDYARASLDRAMTGQDSPSAH